MANSPSRVQVSKLPLIRLSYFGRCELQIRRFAYCAAINRGMNPTKHESRTRRLMGDDDRRPNVKRWSRIIATKRWSKWYKYEVRATKLDWDGMI
jgi:hypothetical protein